jgi:glycosylphosphatidylinositol transamidase (GPIT) subunit GPI8
LFRDVEVDYYQSEITAQAFAEIVMGYYGRETLNKRKIRLSRDEELFVYVTGHGGDTYFKIRER